MSKCESILNSIYCLSQEACTTIDNLKSVSKAVNCIDRYRLYVLLEGLHMTALEAYKLISLNASEEFEKIYISELLSIGQVIKDAYEMFEISFEITGEHIIIEKLENQIEILSDMLYKLNITH